jgi:hypothetical protein
MTVGAAENTGGTSTPVLQSVESGIQASVAHLRKRWEKIYTPNLDRAGGDHTNTSPTWMIQLIIILFLFIEAIVGNPLPGIGVRQRNDTPPP